MATSGTHIIAAMAAKARREVREHFEQANAFDPASAVTYDPPSRTHRTQFDSLVGRGIVKITDQGQYWFDREGERLDDERRRAAALLIMKIVLIGVALAVAGVAIVKATH